MGQASWIPDSPHCSVITDFVGSASGSTTWLFLSFSLSDSSFQKQGAKGTVDSTAWGLAQQGLYIYKNMYIYMCIYTYRSVSTVRESGRKRKCKQM